MDFRGILISLYSVSRFTLYYILVYIIIKTKKFLVALKLRYLIRINIINITTLPSNNKNLLDFAKRKYWYSRVFMYVCETIQIGAVENNIMYKTRENKSIVLIFYVKTNGNSLV